MLPVLVTVWMLADLETLSFDDPALGLPETLADPCSDSSTLDWEPPDDAVNRRFEYLDITWRLRNEGDYERKW